jgi:hypothetical protein
VFLLQAEDHVAEVVADELLEQGVDIIALLDVVLGKEFV